MPHVSMVCTARPTFVVETARERVQEARALLQYLGAEVTGPSDPVMTPEETQAAASSLDPDADLVLGACASFADAAAAVSLFGGLNRPVLLWAFREPGPVGDRLWLNSLCGANLAAHALVAEGVDVRLIYGDPDDAHVRAILARALSGDLPPRVTPATRDGVRAPVDEVQPLLDALRGRRIGLVGDAPNGFTPCRYDPAVLAKTVGLDVVPLAVDDAIDRVGSSDPGARREESEDFASAQPSVQTLDPGEVDAVAGVTTILRGWTEADSLVGVAVRCWPEFPARLGACPCASLSRLADAGVPTACERDVYGLTTMLLLEALGAGTTYLVDTVDLDTDANLVRFWHCGAAATALAADPADATQSVHCNRKVGVAGDFPLRTGPVVVARLTGDASSPSGLRLLLTSGESVPEANRFQGNSAAVVLDPSAEDVVHGLVTGGYPHHTVLAWHDVRPRLRAAADLLDVPVVEW